MSRAPGAPALHTAQPRSSSLQAHHNNPCPPSGICSSPSHRAQPSVQPAGPEPTAAAPCTGCHSPADPMEDGRAGLTCAPRE